MGKRLGFMWVFFLEIPKGVGRLEHHLSFVHLLKPSYYSPSGITVLLNPAPSPLSSNPPVVLPPRCLPRRGVPSVVVVPTSELVNNFMCSPLHRGNRSRRLVVVGAVRGLGGGAAGKEVVVVVVYSLPTDGGLGVGGGGG